MNVNDSQLVDSIMQQFGHVQVEELEKADAIFLMTVYYLLLSGELTRLSVLSEKTPKIKSGIG